MNARRRGFVARWLSIVLCGAVAAGTIACGRSQPMEPADESGSGGPSGPAAGLIVVSGDDWVLSDTAFGALPGDTSRFTVNLARLLTNGAPGRIHAYSDFFAYTGAQLRRTLEGEGHTFTVSTSITFDLATLRQYHALLLGLPLPTPAQLDVLSQYLDAGGRVYIHAGNGIDQPTLVPDAWNPLLSRYGIELRTGFNALIGQIPIVGSHSLLDGVAALYMNAGHPIAGCCAAATTTGGATVIAVASR